MANGGDINPAQDRAEQLLDRAAQGRLSRRRLLELAAAGGALSALSPGGLDTALAAGAQQRSNRQALKAAYDYVVVGAGACGCLIAARLAEAGAEVLLVESGGGDDLPEVATPGLWFTNIGGERDWRVSQQPSPAVNGRRVPVAMGRVLGGGTSVNALLWVRGMAQDFDGWAAEGCHGWGFEDILPVYRALEDWEGGANAWRGAGGPMSVVTAHDPHPTARAFVAAAAQMGTPVLDDMNGPMREGAGFVNMTIDRNGARASASRAYLRPALGRRNLTLLLRSDVARLTFRGTRCTGIELARDGGLTAVGATKEVIVAAGGLHSAKLLMLSGIGEADALRQHGLRPVADLRGVGKNFQDHPLLFGVVCAYKGKMPPHAMTSNAVEAAAYVRSGPAAAGPDIKMVLMQLPIATDEVRAGYPRLPPDAFTISPALVRPTSRGRLRLADADWKSPALLEGGYLETEHDLEATVRCVELCRELARQTAFDDIRAEELIPGRSLTKPQVADFARNAAISFGHPVGTCRMGVDGRAVVDPQLRVHGLQGLRVADSSIMPTIITGPTQAPAQMIAAKAAALILAAG